MPQPIRKWPASSMQWPAFAEASSKPRKAWGAPPTRYLTNWKGKTRPVDDLPRHHHSRGRDRSQDNLSLYPQPVARAARDWIRRARQSARSLARSPERCPLAPESASFDEPIRELFFSSGNRGTYRFLFVVLDKSVYILHVRHGSRLPL